MGSRVVWFRICNPNVEIRSLLLHIVVNTVLKKSQRSIAIATVMNLMFDLRPQVSAQSIFAISKTFR
ncbi:hypothetical protein L6452_28819 [Arctium lappa]|uniref:Uncharacterized protein n=1 Tax=Arctium lappa TaxID=4217 RepID=A0ACB8ZYL6_ARCLA|nr:hypothetical protein L6452_28819 [Arctium lappa]